MSEAAKRKLASIQVIKAIDAIPGADRIEVATILGWKVVVKKGEFKVGDLCVYFEIDSLLPNVTWSKFLDKNNDGKPIRLKTIKLQKQISQGLALPIKEFPNNLLPAVIGGDVTEELKVEKWEPYIPDELRGTVVGAFPRFLKITDEFRIQNYPEVLEEFNGKDVVVTLKLDGTSLTVFNHNQHFGVCSRNWELAEEPNNAYWKAVLKNDLKAKLLRDSCNLGVQAELCGGSIQDNRMGFKEVDMHVFNFFDIGTGRYLNHAEMVDCAIAFGLKTVPVVYIGPWKWNSVEDLLAFAAEQNYPNHTAQQDSPAEGIVIRPLVEAYSEVLGGRLSIKAISNRFLLKYKNAT